MNKYFKLLILIGVASSVFIADLLSKNVILDLFSDDLNAIIVMPILNFVLVKNYGISFGFMNDPQNSKWIFITFTYTLLFVLLAWYAKSSVKQTLFGLAMVIGGACGNLYDRVVHGAVIDFIDFHYSTLHYPAFNIADSFILIGVIVLIFAPLEKTKN